MDKNEIWSLLTIVIRLIRSYSGVLTAAEVAFDEFFEYLDFKNMGQK